MHSAKPNPIRVTSLFGPVATFSIEGTTYASYEAQVRANGTVSLLAYTNENSMYPLTRPQADEVARQVRAMRELGITRLPA